MTQSIFPENFSFQPESRDLKILAQEKIVLPVHKERIHFSIPWENLEEVNHLEKAKFLVLRVRNPRDPGTVLSQGKKIRKNISQSEKEGGTQYALLEEAYPLSLAKLKERLDLYKDRKAGPSHREVYRRRGSLIPLLLSLLSLGSAVLLTQQSMPTQEIIYFLWAALGIGLLSLVFFAAQSLKNDEIHLLADKIKLVSFAVMDELRVLNLQMATIPWENIDSLQVVDQGEDQGMGIRLRRFQDPETSLDPRLKEKQKENYRCHRCDLIIPQPDREKLLSQLKGFGDHLKKGEEKNGKT